jgi:hypothetical protein
MISRDLRKEPPRSPRVRIRDYAILARIIDKCRAAIAGTAGEYHYDCPLDNMLFVFKGITGAELKREVARGDDDEQIGLWVDDQGVPKTPEEITAWSKRIEAYSLFNNLEKRASFIAECQRLGLDPAQATMFDWLEADDKASFQSAVLT